MIVKIDISVQDRYLLVESSEPWILHFNDDKELKYYHGRYIVDLYAKLGSEGHGDQIIRNVWLEYDDRDKPDEVRFLWQTSEIPVQQLTGVDGQMVQVMNFPDIQRVKLEEGGNINVDNFPAFPLSFQVSNFPVFPSSFQVSNFPAFPSSFQVSNFPAFPSSFQVSNFPVGEFTAYKYIMTNAVSSFKSLFVNNGAGVSISNHACFEGAFYGIVHPGQPGNTNTYTVGKGKFILHFNEPTGIDIMGRLFQCSSVIGSGVFSVPIELPTASFGNIAGSVHFFGRLLK